MGLGLEVRGGFFRSGHPAAEVLFEKDGVKVSREMLRRWMVEDGLWLSRKQRRSFHQPRLRREAYGELIQIDGSEHRWFEDRGAPCSLLVFIDDATGMASDPTRHVTSLKTAWKNTRENTKVSGRWHHNPHT